MLDNEIILLKYNKMTDNLKAIEKIVKNTYCIIGIPMLNTRKQPQAQIRGAILTALSGRFKSPEIGEVLNRDRTMVNYYKNNHEFNMRFWKDYKVYYDIAEEQASRIYNEEIKDKEVEIIDRKIELLLQERKELIQK